jgi:arsenate reductase
VLRLKDPYTALFLCTGNSARSILAEALLNELGRGRFIAYSAGSHPNGVVNPFAIEYLAGIGLPVDGLRSKSWNEFAFDGAPRIDFIFTVCDQAAGEVCPFWPGRPMTAHWGVPDPAAVTGTDEEKRTAFKDTASAMRRRIEMFINLPVETLDKLTLRQELKAIGDTA